MDGMTEMFVEFDQFCKDCKYYNKAETEEPCYECLTNPVNINSRKPTMFKESDSSFSSSGKKKENK